VVEVRDLGVCAKRGVGLPPGVTTGLLMTGQFVSIDQANRTERVTISVGAGRSDVRVRAGIRRDTGWPTPRRQDQGRCQE
jgi:hypothetical protein